MFYERVAPNVDRRVHMPEFRGLLIGFCGLACQFCRAYERGLCEGCDAHVGECAFAICASKKGIKCCLSCEGFPCELHREGFDWETPTHGKLRWRVFSDVFLDIMAST